MTIPDLQKHFPTWDQYSLAVIFLFYLKDIFNELTNPILDNYKELLKTIVLYVPSNETSRKSIEETIKEIKKMTGAINKNQYKKLQQDMKTISNNKTLVQASINTNKQILQNQIV